MSEKCHWLWNRHKWDEVYRGHRICSKCGVTQEWDYRLLAWFTRPFDEWLESLNQIKDWDKARWDGQQEKALAWLSQFRDKRDI